MDPHIEACGLWGDFHHELISEIKHSLAEAVPERYLVRAGERSYVEEEHHEAAEQPSREPEHEVCAR